MKEKNEITGYAEVENGMIHIPKWTIVNNLDTKRRKEKRLK